MRGKRGAQVSDITRKVKNELWSVMKSNWTVWVPANIIGYGAIPLNLRVMWGNIIGIFWTAYLIASVRDKKKKTAPEAEKNHES